MIHCVYRELIDLKNSYSVLNVDSFPIRGNRFQPYFHLLKRRLQFFHTKLFTQHYRSIFPLFEIWVRGKRQKLSHFPLINDQFGVVWPGDIIAVLLVQPDATYLYINLLFGCCHFLYMARVEAAGEGIFLYVGDFLYLDHFFHLVERIDSLQLAIVARIVGGAAGALECSASHIFLLENWYFIVSFVYFSRLSECVALILEINSFSLSLASNLSLWGIIRVIKIETIPLATPAIIQPCFRSQALLRVYWFLFVVILELMLRKPRISLKASIIIIRGHSIIISELILLRPHATKVRKHAFALHGQILTHWRTVKEPSPWKVSTKEIVLFGRIKWRWAIEWRVAHCSCHAHAHAVDHLRHEVFVYFKHLALKELNLLGRAEVRHIQKHIDCIHV